MKNLLTFSKLAGHEPGRAAAMRPPPEENVALIARDLLFMMAILAVGFASSAMAAESLWDNFDTYNVGTNLSALSAQGWGASDEGIIVTNTLPGNVTQFAELPPYTIATNVKPAGLKGKVWTDCTVTETMRVDPSSLPLTNTPAAVVMVGVTTDGYAVVYNAASNVWDICTNDARGISLGTGLAPAAWAQISVCEDFDSTNVSVFMDNRLLRQKLPFITVPASYSGLRFKSGVDSTGYVDNVYVSNSIPTALTNVSPTTDINGDGLADAVEVVQFGGIAKMVPGDISTIPAAIAASLAGDRIVVSNATYAASFTLSNKVLLVGRDLSGSHSTNLTIQGNMTVVTGTVFNAAGTFTVTGQVNVVAGGLLTISNTVASFGGLATGAGGKVQVVGGTLAIGGITNGPGTYWTVTNMVTAGVGGSISPSGTNTMLSSWQDVTYALTGVEAFVVASLTNNGAVTNFAAGLKTATYTDPKANITNDQIITVTFLRDGIHYVPGDHSAITDALAVAQANDRIVISNGAYEESLVVSNNVTLAGTNVTGLSSLTVLSNRTAVLSGFTTLYVTNLVIQSNATVVVSNSTLTANGMTLTGTFTLDSGWGGSLTRSLLNFTNDFESYPTNMPLALCGGQGWGASDIGSVVQGVVTAQPYKAAMVVHHSAISNTVSASGVNKVWTDVWLNDSAERVAGFPYPETNANRAVMLFVNTNNHIVIWNSTFWDECTQDVTGASAPTVATGQWVRVTVFEDFTEPQKVALFLNGQLVRQQVPFMSPVSSYQGLMLSAGASAAYLDDVKIWTNVPTGLTNGAMSDLDHDGIADAVEIVQYGSTLVWPRGSVFKIR